MADPGRGNTTFRYTPESLQELLDGSDLEVLETETVSQGREMVAVIKGRGLIGSAFLPGPARGKIFIKKGGAP